MEEQLISVSSPSRPYQSFLVRLLKELPLDPLRGEITFVASGLKPEISQDSREQMRYAQTCVRRGNIIPYSTARYVFNEGRNLFVPVSDLTNGSEIYGSAITSSEAMDVILKQELAGGRKNAIRVGIPSFDLEVQDEDGIAYTNFRQAFLDTLVGEDYEIESFDIWISRQYQPGYPEGRHVRKESLRFNMYGRNTDTVIFDYLAGRGD